jgi:hypothetical protein
MVNKSQNTGPIFLNLEEEFDFKLPLARRSISASLLLL